MNSEQLVLAQAVSKLQSTNHVSSHVIPSKDSSENFKVRFCKDLWVMMLAFSHINNVNLLVLTALLVAENGPGIRRKGKKNGIEDLWKTDLSFGFCKSEHGKLPI